MFIPIILVLFLISFLWAVWSLRKEFKKPKELEHAATDLKREKILYKAK